MSFLLEMGLNSSEQSYVHEDEEEEDDDVVEVVGASLKRERDADEFDDDDDDVDVFGKKKKKKKSCKPTSNFSIMFDSPSLPAKAATTTATKKRSAVDKNINALLEGADEDENDVEGIKADGKKRMQKVLSKIAASAEAENGNGKKTGRRGAGKKKAAVELQTEPSDDAEVQRLKALLADLNSNSYGKVRHVDIPLDDLDVEVPSALKAGVVGGSKAMPRSSAPIACSHRLSQLPLNPVCPVMSTLRPCQNSGRVCMLIPTSSKGRYRWPTFFRGCFCRAGCPWVAKSRCA
jgi:hypothetical protein